MKTFQLLIIASLLLLPPFSLATEQQSTHNSDSGANSAEKKSEREESADKKNQDSKSEKTKKLLNDAADSEAGTPDGQDKIQEAVTDFVSGLSKEEKQQVEKAVSEKDGKTIDSLLTKSGLVLSNPGKREAFLKSFQLQLKINSDLQTLAGLQKVVSTANSKSNGDETKAAEIRSAKAALRGSVKEHQIEIDYLKSKLGVNDESQLLMTVKSVETAVEDLKRGNDSQKAAASNFLYGLGGTLYGAEVKGIYQNKEVGNIGLFQGTLEKTAFASSLQPFVTGGLGQNSGENPKYPDGICAGLQCMRQAIAKASYGNEAKSPADAVKQFETDGKLPKMLLSPDGKQSPLHTQDGSKALAVAFMDKERMIDPKNKTPQELIKLRELATQYEKELYFKDEKVLTHRLSASGSDGLITWVRNYSPSGEVNGHAITLHKLGNGHMVVTDPNIPGVAPEVNITKNANGGLGMSYSYFGKDGKSHTYRWEHFMERPQ